MQLYWDEFLRHFRLCDKEDSGLSLTKTKTGRTPQIAQSTHENEYIKPRKLLEYFKTISYRHTKIIFSPNHGN